MNKPILFLDIDGVLNSCGMEGGMLPHSDKVDRLKRIIDSTGCDVVLSSTWRRHEDHLQHVRMMMAGIGCKLRGCTPVMSWLVSRGVEIKHWLDCHKVVDNFVILDDGSDMHPLMEHLVRTSSYVGLTDDITDEVIRRLQPTC